MKTNQEYKNAALDRLRGNWAPAVIATIVYMVLAIVCAGSAQVPTLLQGQAVPHAEFNMGLALGCGGASFLLSLFILGPVLVGFANANRLLYERRDYNVTRNMTDIAMSNYLHKVLGVFLMELKVFPI